MRIVYLADAPYPHTQRWVEHFVRRGDECEVVSFRPAEIAGARVHYVDGGESLGKARYLLHARRVKALIESLSPDLVHALHLTSYGFLAALSGARPLVVSVWGTDILEAPSLTPFHRWLTRYALAQAEAITATGLHLAVETTRHAPRSRPVTVVPYGVDLERFSPVERRAAGDAVVAGCVTRLSPEKGVRYLIEAFALLRERYGDRLRLRIAGDDTGDGRERRRTEEQVAGAGLDGSVELLGWVDHASLPAFLQDVDIYVQPSLFEGFGVAAAEAAAMELPIVASNVHGLPDVVRHGRSGYLVPPRDAAALAAAVARLVDDPPLRTALGKAGRELVAAQYDWQANAAQMERVYSLALKGRQAGVGAWT